MTFSQAIKSVFKTNYANFNGRAPRSEYWFAYLGFFLALIIPIVLMMAGADPMTGSMSGIGKIGMILYLLLILLALIPNIAVCVRRLHDQDKSGWWLAGLFVPFLNIYVLIMIWFLKGTNGENRFGPDPLA